MQSVTSCEGGIFLVWFPPKVTPFGPRRHVTRYRPSDPCDVRNKCRPLFERTTWRTLADFGGKCTRASVVLHGRNGRARNTETYVLRYAHSTRLTGSVVYERERGEWKHIDGTGRVAEADTALETSCKHTRAERRDGQCQNGSDPIADRVRRRAAKIGRDLAVLTVASGQRRGEKKISVLKRSTKNRAGRKRQSGGTDYGDDTQDDFFRHDHHHLSGRKYAYIPIFFL